MNMESNNMDIAYNKSGKCSGEKLEETWPKMDKVSKSPIKRKESEINMVTNFLKASYNEIKSEIEAMIGTEYNLHDDCKTIDVPTLPPKKAKKGQASFAKSNNAKPEKTVLRMEKTTVKPEKLEADGQIVKPLYTASIEELQAIVRQVGNTSEDKYKILEARDRLMRLKQVKSHSLETAKVTSGICPDMCPEKERLMRESQRQVATYEQLEGNEYRINHATAVKQYSRSSADQEEPMAHELRPVKSLRMTMSYLLHEIADICEDEGINLGEWYHFLWDRTRGIRKDITQQELCCVDSVELVEQCARFHIVCSEKLCAEESSVFDKKINSENLTKCLQSLKYMYHDLRMNGIVCPNEAEFRAYVILLNLNNSNFMWDLQQLPLSIQKSPEVQFAIEVYFSLESNNYYRFFKLVRQTTYLNACILLRYFNQVRVKALSIIVKAYCRTMSTPYPLYELLHILGFEDENEIIYFCEQMGLQLSKDEMHIMLNRQNFNLPESNIEQGRAHYLIEMKRITQKLSIGQSIAGGTMPEKLYKNHKPHNSFDSKGYLMPESMNAEDQSTKANSTNDPYEFVDAPMSVPEFTWHNKEKNDSTGTKNSALPATIKCYDQFKIPVTSTNDQSNVSKPTTLPEPKGNIFFSKRSDFNLSYKPHSRIESITQCKDEIKMNNEIKKDSGESVTKGNLLTSKQDQTFTIASKSAIIFPKSESTSLHQANTEVQVSLNKNIFMDDRKINIFSKSTAPVIFGRNSTPIDTQQSTSSVETFQNKFNKPMQNIFAQNQQLSQSGSKKIEETETKNIREKEVKDSIKQIQKNTKILHQLITDVIEDCCSIIVREEINKLKMYDSFSEITLTKVINEMCDSLLTEEIENHKRMDEIRERIKSKTIFKWFNMWRQYALKKKQQREALDNTPVWLQKYSVDACAKLLYCKEQKFAIQNMRKKYSLEESEKPVANSLTPIEVIIYGGIKENLKSLDIDTLPNCFWKLVISWPNLENKTDLWRHKKIINEYLSPNNFTTEPIIKHFQPNPHENFHICIRYFEGLITDHNLFGTDALLFIAAAVEDPNSVIKRLTRIILSRNKLMPIPLVFIVLGDGNLHAQNETIVTNLTNLVESGYISEYTVAYERTLTKATVLSLTQSTILWLAINKSHPNPLEMDYLQNVLDICITEELWLRILGDSEYNKKLSDALAEPNFIINLHNETIVHIMDIILDPESHMYTKFPPEFKKFLKNQHIMPYSYEYFDDSWETEEHKANVEDIMNNLTLPRWNSSWPIEDTHTLHKSLMHYCQQVLPDTNSNIVSCDILSNLYITTGSLQVSTFIDILLPIVRMKIHFITEDLKIVYNKNHIKHFRILPWWFKSNVFIEFVSRTKLPTKSSLKRKNKTEESIGKKRKSSSYNEDDLETSYEVVNISDPLADFCKDTQSKVVEVHSTSQILENRLKNQRLQSQLFEERLNKALHHENIIT